MILLPNFFKNTLLCFVSLHMYIYLEEFSAWKLTFSQMCMESVNKIIR